MIGNYMAGNCILKNHGIGIGCSPMILCLELVEKHDWLFFNVQNSEFL